MEFKYFLIRDSQKKLIKFKNFNIKKERKRKIKKKNTQTIYTVLYIMVIAQVTPPD